MLPVRCCRLRLLWVSLVVTAIECPGSQPDAVTAGAGNKVLQLPTVTVWSNPVEDFGFRVSPDFDVVRSSRGEKVYTPVVDLVLPNTAASKAGVQPGDRIVRADGVATGTDSFSLRTWERLQRAKWREVRESPREVAWSLELAAAGSGELRQVQLLLPTPAPRWGSPVWQKPAGRTWPRLAETGRLAERTQQVMDHGIAMLLRRTYVEGFGFETSVAQPNVIGYQWTLWDQRGGHRMFVTWHRGRPEVILEFIARANQRLGRNERSAVDSPDPTLASERTVLGTRAWAYLTDPRGELSAAWMLGAKQTLGLAGAQPGFAAELDFWLDQVDRVSERWPLELKAETR